MTAVRHGAIADASLDRLDAVASAMERKWGVDRPLKLVDAPLAVRFRSQAERLDEAIRSGVSAAVSAQAEAMLRAWHAVDAAALAAGWKPLSPTIWETVLPGTGEVIAIVRDSDEASALAKERTGVVWTLAEVAIAIEAFGDGVRSAKVAFPGAGIEAAGPTGATAAARFDSRASDVATGRETQPAARVPAQNRKRRPVGFPESRAPLLNPSTGPSSTKPPIDWDRGDDIPF